MKQECGIPLVDRAALHLKRIALIDADGEYTYEELLIVSKNIASFLLDGKDDLQEMRVAFMVPPSFIYPALQWGTWRAGGIAVPLCVSHPAPELEYVVNDADADIIIAHPKFETTLRPIAERKKARFVLTTDIPVPGDATLPVIDVTRRAMILYTSGTTGKPKGVVTTHKNTAAQITSLIDAWEWSTDDAILGVLPLHHVHGIINIMSCALWAGAVCELLPKFDANEVWKRFIERNYTLFMAVPTVYVRLIKAWENASDQEKDKMTAACTKFRLMVSGSAALPVSVFEKWQSITGQTFLERYGMTEIGMGISNPLHGQRRPGYIGMPLPGVDIRLVDESGNVISKEGVSGEIQIRGDNVFLEYWGKPEATLEAFQDGWFISGDVAVVENGYFRILGRQSVDIIKTGGYKVSALEIEEVLRTHPNISECAVVGVEDAEWGERVCAAAVLKENTSLSIEELRNWAKQTIAVYKVPSRLLVLDDLPRNAMGKVTKPDVKVLFH